MKRAFLVGLIGAVAIGGCKKDEPETNNSATKTPEVQKEAPAPEVQEPAFIGEELSNKSAEERVKMLTSGDATQFREAALYQVMTRASLVQDEAMERAVLVHGGNAQKPNTKPLYIGYMGAQNLIFFSLREELSIPNVCGAECRVPFYNALLKPFSTEDVFKGDGALDPKALKNTIDALYIKPDASLLGVQAKDVYPVVRPIVYEWVMTHKAIRTLGKDEVLAEFEAEKAKGESLVPFYKDFATKKNLGMLAGLDSNRSHFALAGFWMRRLADGSEPVLDAALKIMLKDYDQELLDESMKK